MFPAAKRHFEGTEEACTVYNCSAGFHSSCYLECSLLVFREYAAGKSENRAVSDFDGFFIGIKSDDRNDWSEDFHVLGYICSLRNIYDNGRFIESTVSLASQDDLASLFYCESNFLFYLDGGLFADQAGDLRLIVGRISIIESLDFGDSFFCKFVLKRIVDQKTPGWRSKPDRCYTYEPR